MKRIIVTGATGGIGKSVSGYLAKEGYQVLMFARNFEKLKMLSRELSNSTHENATFSLDLGSVRDVDQFNFAELGKIDGLVMMPPQLDPTADPFATPELWRNYFENGFIGPLRFIQNLVPNLKQSKRAKVVFISGISSLQVLSHYATSNVLRCAWVAQGKTLAHALGSDNIHFNTISLGGVLTDDYLAELKDDALKAGKSIESILSSETSNVPLKKYAMPIEVAYAVSSLLGNFSDHITGVNIAVDGGFTRAY